MKQEDKAFLELAEKFRQEDSLTEKDKQIIERWKFAHDKQVHDFLHGKDLEQAIIDQFNVSHRTARYDVRNSQKFFITEEMIDRDFWRGLLLQWQLKGLKLAFEKDKIKEFNNGIRNLYLILGLHKSGKAITPKMLKQHVYNFFGDPKRLGIPEVEDAQIIELVESIIQEENLTPDQKEKLLKDAGIHRNEQSSGNK